MQKLLKNYRLNFLLATLLFAGVASAAPLPPIHVVTVDPLIKIFRNEAVTGSAHGQADSARGEQATFQVVVTSSPVDLKDVRCTVTTFTRTGGNEQLSDPQLRYVGYVGSSISGLTTASDILRPAPAMYPDPLLPIEKIDVSAGDNQAIWISVPIATDVPPGDYIATSTLTARRLGVETSATVPLTVRVYPATINTTRLNVTLWHQMWTHDNWPMPKRYSDGFFAVLNGYVKSMVAHRQNWGWIETLDAIQFSRDKEGMLQADFTHFDKWMDTLLDGGLQMVEGQHFAFRTKGWRSDFGVTVYQPDGEKWTSKKLSPDSPEAREFYAAWFPQLQNHLEEKGWLDKYVQHVGDEPLDANVDSYTTAAALLKQYAPKLRIMEACQSQKMVGTVDIWIPQLDHFHKGYDFFKERKAAGDQVWFYTCMYPAGEYANRFLELPLIKTRLLHWINYRYGADGYLHWGYNFWTPHPWEDAADYRQAQLPGGDANIVYPDPDGPGVIDSIRYEAMRDGIEDHELLSQLGEKDPEAAMGLAQRHILNFDKYDTDIQLFRETRQELLKALSQ